MKKHEGGNTYKKCVTTAHNTETQPSPPFLDLYVRFLARNNGASQGVSRWHLFWWVC